MLVEQFSYYEYFTDRTNGCMQSAVHNKKKSVIGFYKIASDSGADN